jgi:hypothetical protein
MKAAILVAIGPRHYQKLYKTNNIWPTPSRNGFMAKFSAG